jgi:gliding motility-associated lipoprotein GldH
MTNPTANRNRRTKAAVFFLCLLFFSCKSGTVYHRYQPVEGGVWEKDREYAFTCRIEDAAALYNITFELRNNNFYPYQNLWIFYAETPPARLTEKRDTLECMLADEFGKWLGKGISLYQSAFPLRSRYTFPAKGSYTFSFRQGMRNDSLAGIREIGLRIEKVR